MKVEFSPDVQTVRQLDQPAVSPTSASAPVVGMDELAHLFSQEVDLNSRALSERTIGVRVLPAEQLAHIYDQLGHPAQATLASISRRVRWQLLQQPDVGKLLEIAGGDPARAFVVLKYVAALADTEVRPSEAALARDAIAKLEVRFKGQIQAGLNIAVALQAASVDPQERQALRTLYYASVVSYLIWPATVWFPLPAANGMSVLIDLLGDTFTHMMLYAAPFIAVLLLLEFGIALLGVYSQQLQVSTLAPPVKCLAGIGILLLYFALLQDLIVGRMSQLGDLKHSLRLLIKVASP